MKLFFYRKCFHQHIFQAQFKIGIAYITLGKYEQGYQQMCRTYNTWPTSPLKDDVLCNLAKCYSKCIAKGNPFIKLILSDCHTST